MRERSEGVGEGEEGPAVGPHIQGGVVGRRERVPRELEDVVDVVVDGRIGGGGGEGVVGDGGGSAILALFLLLSLVVLAGGLFAFGLRGEMPIEE